MGNKAKDYDFSGWATRPNVKCSDGRTILPDAFADQNGTQVPLVYQHGHSDIEDVLGHAVLESRKGGIYAYGYLNSTPKAKVARECLEHGDVSSLSIWANQLLPKHSSTVSHGVIRELSLVLAGANPFAYVDNVIYHSDGSMRDLPEDEAVMWGGDGGITFYEKDISLSEDLTHSNDETEESKEVVNEKEELKLTNDPKSIHDIYESMNEDQKRLFAAAMLANNAENLGDDQEEEDNNNMKHNVFEENGAQNSDTNMSHVDFDEIMTDAKKNKRSLKDTFVQHMEEGFEAVGGDSDSLKHGITNIDYLFPEPTELNKVPEFIKVEPSGWVSDVMSSVHHVPFSRIKTSFADITEQEARALGYIKGTEKVDETISLLKRTTEPTTIYKKQSFDRDDLVDITDFDVVAWIRGEMRMKLDEELARAYLVGDGRLTSDNYKIDETRIRPVASDAALYSVPVGFMYDESTTETDDDADVINDVAAKHFIDTAIRSRRAYRGSGSPTLYITEELLSQILILRDKIGRRLYESEADIARILRVKKVVSVPSNPPAEGTRPDGLDMTALHAIIVNLSGDYYVGADRGGAINTFSDFDIDFNKEKLLIETRCSGCLVRPYSALCYFHLNPTETTATQFAWQKKNILIDPNHD